MYVNPQPQQSVELSPRLDVTRQHDSLSDPSLPSYTFPSPSPAAESLFIPGYGVRDPAVPLRRGQAVGLGGGVGLVVGPGSSSVLVPEPGGGLRNTANSPTGSQPRAQVEQVHVAKCAVCTIL